MQDVVTWWCNLIGITSEAAIQTASGVFGGITLAAIFIIILIVALAIYGAVSDLGARKPW